MKLILLISLLLSCSKHDYDYFFEKAPIYKGKTNFYFKDVERNSLTKKQIPRNELPISAFLFEMPFDFVIALEDLDCILISGYFVFNCFMSSWIGL